MNTWTSVVVVLNIYSSRSITYLYSLKWRWPSFLLTYLIVSCFNGWMQPWPVVWCHSRLDVVTRAHCVHVFVCVVWCRLPCYRGIRAGRWVHMYLAVQPSIRNFTYCPVIRSVGNRPTLHHHRTPLSSRVFVCPQHNQPDAATMIDLLNL